VPSNPPGYPQEKRERAVRMVAELRADYPSEGAAIAEVARLLGISPGTLRNWVRQQCSDKRCSKADPKGHCECECGGVFHGSTRRSAAKRATPTPSEPQPVPQQSSTTLRRVTLAIAAVATVTIGPFVVHGSFDSSAPAGDDLKVQVSVDLNKALSALDSILRFRTLTGPSSGATGPSVHKDCAMNATYKVKGFLKLNHCNQYASATRTITRQGTTTQVVFSWVEMPSDALAASYKQLVDWPGTGNPPGASLAFDGSCYASGLRKASLSTVWTVLVHPTGNVKVDREILQVAAPQKLTPGYLGKHCIN
jgi:transposase-like protein